MTFMQFLKSLDDLLYELVTWLVFYPVTLWRTLRRPWSMMEYADDELQDSEDEQYTDTLSPPIFLLLTLLLCHAVEIALFGQNPLIASQQGMSRYIKDDTSLLLMRMLFFSVFPLILSVNLLWRQKVPLTRDSLKRPFYAQCYPASAFALVLSLGLAMVQLHRWPAVEAIGLATTVIAFLWFGGLQSYWFARTLGISGIRGFGLASLAMIECVLMSAVILPIFA